MKVFTPEFKKTMAKGKTFAAWTLGYCAGSLHVFAITKGWI